MAEISPKLHLDTKITFVVSEAEARALDALVGYGDDAFIKAFYESLGKAYMQPHEAGLRQLFCSVRQQMPGVLDRLDKIKSAVHFASKG